MASTKINEISEIDARSSMHEFNAYRICERLSSDLTGLVFQLVGKKFSKVNRMDSSVEEKYEALADICRDASFIHYNWSLLSGRLTIEKLRLTTIPATFSESLRSFEHNVDPDFLSFVTKHGDTLNEMVEPSRDMFYDALAMNTLIKSYLGRVRKDGNVTIKESPQFMFMRVATFLWYPRKGTSTENMPLPECFRFIKRTYDSLSQKKYIHASPTLFNAGLKRHSLTSCFLGTIADDMIEISNNVKDCMIISSRDGGIGMDVSRLRHSEIADYGYSKGLIGWMGIYNAVMNTVDQCFPGHTFVHTLRGPKRIENILPGDILIRADGKTNRVRDLIIHNIGKNSNHAPLLNLKTTRGSRAVEVTNSHPFYSFYGGCYSSNQLLERLKEGKIVPEYIPANDLTTKHWVCHPIMTYEKDIEILSVEDCIMLGIMIATFDGVNNDGDIDLRLESASEGTLDFVSGYTQNNCIDADEFCDDDTGYTYFSFKSTLARYIKSNKIWHRLISLPYYKLKQILFGLLCIEDEDTSSNYYTVDLSNYCEIFESDIVAILEGLAMMFARIGVAVKIAKKHDYNAKPVLLLVPKTDVINKLMYSESPDIPMDNMPFIYDNKVWYKIVSNTPSGSTYDVLYDIEMIKNSDNDEENEKTANYTTELGLVHNGGKRKGSAAMYIADWHIDVIDAVKLKMPQTNKNMSATELFYGVWMSELFIERVKTGGDWYLFCPNKAKGLNDVWGAEFKTLYEKYERDAIEGKIPHQKHKARDVMNEFTSVAIRTGIPYVMFKDAVNMKSNQKNLGIITLGNLCTEIAEYTKGSDDENGKKEIASCNLASLCLSAFVKTDDQGKPWYDFEELARSTEELVENLNQVIDRTLYIDEIPAIKYSNMRHRPMAIGVQGLADAAALLDYPFDSPETFKLNHDIFETMYYAACKKSMELAIIYGRYETFEGSPMSKGKFQFDLHKEFLLAKKKSATPADFEKLMQDDNSRHDWSSLRQEIMKNGLRNSLLIGLMPTASTSHITGNNECFQPFVECIYKMTVLSGQCIVTNRYLVDDLIKINLWNTDNFKRIISDHGSIESIPEDNLTPEVQERLRFLKKKYKTIFNISHKVFMDMAADRGQFVCQSQSFNMWDANPTCNNIAKRLCYASDIGLKTGLYYLRQLPKATAINFSADDVEIKVTNGENCTDEICISCQ